MNEKMLGKQQIAFQCKCEKHDDIRRGPLGKRERLQRFGDECGKIYIIYVVRKQDRNMWTFPVKVRSAIQ